jgi:hypothetical protein
MAILGAVIQTSHATETIACQTVSKEHTIYSAVKRSIYRLIKSRENLTKEVMEFRIAHFTPTFLNIYGDRGNIITLSQRAKWRGIEVKVDAIDIGQEAIDPDYYDFYFMSVAVRTSNK